MVSGTIGAFAAITYGFDGPTEVPGADGETNTVYGSQHVYYLSGLPRIWAEKDSKNAAGNPVLAETRRKGNLYRFASDIPRGKNGSYLRLSARYAGKDAPDRLAPEDETADAAVILGVFDGAVFHERYRYHFTLQEGEHDYIFRVSNDYYWYSDAINAVWFSGPVPVSDMEMSILQGD